jgi:hypothetical protein
MISKKLILGSLFLSGALMAPMAIVANAAPQGISVRFYDRDHKDYHNWDDREEHSYGIFRSEHPDYDSHFAKAKRKQQREYWKWRHEHPDHD